VDNTPEPEPEDVTAHLIGGIPQSEVAAQAVDFARFKVESKTLFGPWREGYLAFVEAIATKSAIKGMLEADANLQNTINQHYEALESWWQVARDDFAQLREGKKMPEVRRELLTGLKDKLLGLGVLDEFQAAGVFVNWWQQIRYDLKTIVNTGWHHTLIPDEYLIAAFFQEEVKAIKDLEGQISAAQGELSEAIETAQEVASYEPEEDETVTATSIKKVLKDLMDDLKNVSGISAARELAKYKAEYEAIAKLEKQIKDLKADVKEKQTELDIKLRLKRVGGEEFQAETEGLIQQVIAEIAGLKSNDKDDKRKIAGLTKDKEALEKRLTRIDGLLVAIGGQLTTEEAKGLILQKLYDWVREQLTRYLNGAKRSLIALVEKLWDKYAVSSQELEAEREETLAELNQFLSKLGYLA
jgi:type I restriction enzyme M protein